MSREFIQFGEHQISVIRHPRRKRLSLEMNIDGPSARAPENMPLRTIEQFVEQHQSWIEKQLAKRPLIQQAPPLANGSTIKLLDEVLTLKVQQQARGSAKRQADTLILPVKQLSDDHIKKKLIRWYQQQCQLIIPPKVESFAQQMGIALNNKPVRVRSYKRRWGSCDNQGQLSFNWRIVMASEPIIDYVVVHELAHLLKFNHSRKFWSIVEQQMPHWKQAHQWLKDNGWQLYLL